MSSTNLHTIKVYPSKDGYSAYEVLDGEKVVYKSSGPSHIVYELALSKSDQIRKENLNLSKRG